jgi:hypothetical protein
MIEKPEGYYSSNEYLVKKVGHLTTLVLGLLYPREEYAANPVPGYDCWDDYVQTRCRYLTDSCESCTYDLDGEFGEIRTLTPIEDENGEPHLYCDTCLQGRG